MTDDGLIKLGAAIAIGLGSLGPSLAIGWIVGSALTAVGENPNMEGAIKNTMILGCGLAEAISIYAFVIALILALVI